jgi:hypothetical protein
MNLGTLYTCNPREFADAALSARDFTKLEPIMSARSFKALGYYARGGRRIAGARNPQITN